MNQYLHSDYQFDYNSQYIADPHGNSWSGRLFAYGHRMLEDAFGHDKEFETVLEVGAGTGSHVAFVKHRYSKYIVTDRSLRINDRIERSGDAGQISFAQEDACRLSYDDKSFDRLIASHVLEHLPNPDDVLKEWLRVVKDNGIISILLPCDPGIMWRCARTVTRYAALKNNIPYDFVMAKEHINTIFNLRALIRFYFPYYEECWWPLRIPIIDGNLFYGCHINKKPINALVKQKRET